MPLRAARAMTGDTATRRRADANGAASPKSSIVPRHAGLVIRCGTCVVLWGNGDGYEKRVDARTVGGRDGLGIGVVAGHGRRAGRR